MFRMGPLLAALLLSVAPSDSDVAWAHYDALPEAEKPYAAYVSFASIEDETRPNVEAAFKVVTCSLSSKSHLPSQLPQRLKDTTVFKLDLQALGWETVWRRELIEHYPLRKDLTAQGLPPLVIDGFWFVTNVVDPIKTGDMQYQLLYQGKPPKNLVEFQAAWKVDAKSPLAWGFSEGKSGVAVNRRRTMASFPTASRGGSFWLTFDFEKLNAKTDPTENFVPFTHRVDAQEAIAFIIKADGRKSGTLPVWFLSDAKGNRQEKAPASIVVDHTELRGVEIRNTISCYACHPLGVVAPTLDEYDTFFKSGAQAKVYDKQTLRDIEAFYEADIAGDLKASQSLYAAGVEMVCGLSPEKFTAAFVAAVKAYDADVSLDQAAREIGCTPEDLKLAIAWQSAKGVNVGARLASLPHGVAIPRERFEELSYVALGYVKAWRASK